MAARQFCTFTLGQHFFGVPVEEVQEVMRSAETTRVPLAHPAVRGLINLRGQILLTIDLRRRLELEVLDVQMSPVHLVLRTVDGAVALLVDAMGDVLDVDDDCFETSPETLDPRIRKLILGAYKLENRLLLFLNTANTANVASESESSD